MLTHPPLFTYAYRIYAVKRIPFDKSDKTMYRNLMREVRTLSQVHHANVIRYYQCWEEQMTQEEVTLFLQDEENEKKKFTTAQTNTDMTQCDDTFENLSK